MFFPFPFARLRWGGITLLAALTIPFVLSVIVHQVLASDYQSAVERAQLSRRAEIAANFGLEYGKFAAGERGRLAFLRASERASCDEHVKIDDGEQLSIGTIEFADGGKAMFLVRFSGLKPHRQLVEVRGKASMEKGFFSLTRRLRGYNDESCTSEFCISIH